jgi:hypothetical protein
MTWVQASGGVKPLLKANNGASRPQLANFQIVSPQTTARYLVETGLICHPVELRDTVCALRKPCFQRALY